MAKQTREVTGPVQVDTVGEGEALADKWLAKHPDDGYKSRADLVFCYLVPYALRRLGALERYAAKNPKTPKPRKARAKKAAA